MLGDYDVCKKCNKRGFFDDGECDECKQEKSAEYAEKYLNSIIKASREEALSLINKIYEDGFTDGESENAN